MSSSYLLDTSVVIDSVDNIRSLSREGENLIIITDVVLSESDHLKTTPGSVGYMARRFNNFLKDADVTGVESHENHTVTHLLHDNVRIDLVAQERYKEGFANNYQNVVNDRRIIETALWAEKQYPNLVVVSNDVAFRTYAIAKGLKVDSVRVTERDEIQLEFVREIEIEYDYLGKLNLLEIGRLQQDLGITLGEHEINLVFKLRHSDHEVLAQVVNGRVEVLDEERLRDCKLPPRNKEQLFYAGLIMNPMIDLVLSSSPSGSGKTALAVAMGMKLIDNPRNTYEKIVYIRNPIDSVDKDAYIGFKKGDMDEKMGGYFTPIYDALDTFARAQMKKSSRTENDSDRVGLKIEEFIKQYNISFPYIGNLRGANLDRSIVIIDEAQNFSLSSMQLVLTRVTDSSKVIVIGDINQVDSIYLSKLNNALSFLLNQTQNPQSGVRLGAITLKKSIRGRICEWAEELFSRHKQF